MSHIQWDAWSAIGTIASAFLTLGAVIITNRTISEMQKQRQQSLMPKLVIKPAKHFTIYKEDNERNEYTIWSHTPLENFDYLPAPRNYNYSVDLNNIGIGPAQSIRFNYWIDRERILSLFEENQIIIDELNLEDEGLKVGIHSGDDYIGLSIGKIDLEFEELYIPNSNDNYQLRLPKIYLALFAIYINAFLKKNPRDENHWNNFPALRLRIDYRDIAESEYHSDFRIRFNLYGRTLNVDNYSRFSGTVIVERN